MRRTRHIKSTDIIKYEYILTEELREVLKEPLGLLVSNDSLTYEEIARHIDKSEIVVTVGDATTERLISLGVVPSVQIVDGREMRIERDLPISKIETQLKASNPAGQISRESLMALSTAIKARKPVRIIIDGEEDLLTLPTIALFPNCTSVLYGQPGRGAVIIKVDQRSREMAISFLDKMVIKCVHDG
ncbi:MAG: GTP-dependent dephospho-CoA kinase family protein [Candidatus Methylarchaceae archaeon HK02M1]|nr:GTP-dependent dephospho-CoA kinase family protein [Candidatus Methylarchaceae archaeon HK01M]MCP8312617.1 GTP-dependent dephospho-CoA kinase family protein [Candidatus Methylarchaceae archaeon HK02M1]